MGLPIDQQTSRQKKIMAACLSTIRSYNYKL